MTNDFLQQSSSQSDLMSGNDQQSSAAQAQALQLLMMLAQQQQESGTSNANIADLTARFGAAVTDDQMPALAAMLMANE